jgi:hypothetical protein
MGGAIRAATETPRSKHRVSTFEWCAYFRGGIGFQYVTDGRHKLFRNERDEEIPIGADEYFVDAFTRKAFKFLAQKDERPFFLYLSYYPPHWPPEVPESFLKLYKDIKDVRRRTACATIASVDDAVGKVKAKLAAQYTPALDDKLGARCGDFG